MTIEQPRLVLLPGMDGTGLLFARFVEALGSNLDIQIISYPSEVCSYDQVMDVLASAVDVPGPYVLLAESFSTPVALRHASLYPEHLLGVVLVAGFASSPIRNSFLSTIVSKAAPILMRLPKPSAFVHLLLGFSGSDVELVKRVIGSVPSSTLAKRLVEVLKLDVSPQVRVPMLYLQGENDQLVKDSSVGVLTSRYPSMQVEKISGGHLLLQSSPRVAAEKVRKFVAALSSLQT